MLARSDRKTVFIHWVFGGYSANIIQKETGTNSNLEFALHILHTAPDNKIDKVR